MPREARLGDHGGGLICTAGTGFHDCASIAASLRVGPQKELFISSLDFAVDPSTIGTWTRLQAALQELRGEDLKKHLRRIVKEGVEKAFREPPQPQPSGPGNPATKAPWHPGVAISCPYLEVGKIKTFDAEEIVGIAALAKLIRKYLRDEKWSTPLSIAVFGPPGSGKSFAVKELLKSINPAAGDALTYNLAQFDSVATLTEAFHHVQDRALSSDEVPLVIFDEFDATFGDPLGWLKYFLAPMQDGVFRGQSGEYRVGRAIFLFAGGTSMTFKEFKSKQAKLSSAKLTDFISRLKGYLDVVDINPPKGTQARETDQQTLQRKVKRAVVLRSLLQQFAKPILRPVDGDDDTAAIADAVIDAFLNVSAYEHGVRSMESVVCMSRWIDGSFLAASLPEAGQLDIHAPGFWAILQPETHPPYSAWY